MIITINKFASLKYYLFLLLFISFNSSIFSQSALGINMGSNYSDIYIVNDQSFNESGETIIPKIGVNLGLYVNLKFNKIFISSGLGYSMQRVKVTNNSPLALIKLTLEEDQIYSHFIELPLSLSFSIYPHFNIGFGLINSFYVTDINNAAKLNNKFEWYRGGVQTFLSYDIFENFRTMISFKYNGLTKTWQHPSITIEVQYDLFKF